MTSASSRPFVRTAWLPVLVTVGLLVSWFGLSRAGILTPLVFPRPETVATAFGEEIAAGRLATDIIASVFRVAVGFCIATLLGVPLGLWLGHHLLARSAFLPIVNFLRNLSPIAWIPFAIFWFGVGDTPVIFLIFMATFPPMCMATASAVAGIPRVYFQVARDFGLKGRALFTQVTLPAILPQIITHLRVVIGVAWVIVVAAEMIAGRDGLGYLIWDARNGLRTDLLVVGMITIGTVGLLLDNLVSRLTYLPFVRWGYER